jgi:DNA-directed RNA polymerase specialized sigma24 family protein
MVYLKYDQYKNAATIADALDKKVSTVRTLLHMRSDLREMSSLEHMYIEAGSYGVPCLV